MSGAGARAAYQTVEGQVHQDLMALAERARDVQRFLTNAMVLQVPPGPSQRTQSRLKLPRQLRTPS